MCVSKHGFSRHSQALLGRSLKAGRGTRGSRRSPNPVGGSREEAWPGSSWAQTSPGIHWTLPTEEWGSHGPSARVPMAILLLHACVCLSLQVVCTSAGLTAGFLRHAPPHPPPLHVLGRAPAGQLWTMRAKPPDQGWEWSRWVGEISQDSLLRDSLRVASQPEGPQGCGLGNRQGQPAAPLPGLKAASCCVWRAGFGKAQPSVVP